MREIGRDYNNHWRYGSAEYSVNIDIAGSNVTAVIQAIAERLQKQAESHFETPEHQVTSASPIT